MKRYCILLTILLAAVACKNNTVDFSYSPAQPRAGESVSFTNLCEEGDEWEWSFGDIATSSSKSPSKVYKRPDTYTVTLKVDGKSNRTCTKEITIYDTIPTITFTQDTFNCPGTVNTYEPVEFTASIYNPYGHTMSYEWFFDADAPFEVLSKTKQGLDSLTGYQLKVLVTEAGNPQMNCRIVERYTLNGGDSVHYYTMSRSLQSVERPAESVVFTADGTDYAQRWYYAAQRNWFTAPMTGLPDSIVSVINGYDDTRCSYNGTEYELASITAVFPFLGTYSPLGFVITDGRIFFRNAEGLYVSLLSGANTVTIDSNPASALCLDRLNNRLYWATAEGLRCMPPMRNANNRFDESLIEQVNTLGGITRVAPCYTKY